MNSKTESIGTAMDTAKLVVAALLFSAAVVLYYVFGDVSALLRTLGVLAAAGVALAIASQTATGRQTSKFLHDAQIEIRKVVWPTPAETRQTTLIVIVMVFIAALFLWGLDSLLGTVVRSIMTPGRG